MTNIWAFLLQTLTLSVTALLLLLIKRILEDKLSPRWQYGVWSVLLLSALIPANFLGRQGLLRLRTIRTLLTTVLTLPLPQTLLTWMPFVVVLVLVNFVVAVRIMAQLFTLRHAFPEPETEE